MGKTDTDTAPRRGALAARALSSFVPLLVLTGALLFGTAGSLGWGLGWRYLAAVAAMMTATLCYFALRDPALLESRLRQREGRKAQRGVMAAGLLASISLFAIPGIDRRLGWSRMPEAVAWAGLAVAALGYALFFAVMRTNGYASRSIGIREGQRLIDAGPYAIVRHPMYSASMLFYLGSAVALGSWWALIPAAANLPVLAFRIRDEEAMLMADLAGYADYRARVRRRMIPGLW
jgi:protein-S-isoprenylcysteine O-methyltransferase Ste14